MVGACPQLTLGLKLSWSILQPDKYVFVKTVGFADFAERANIETVPNFLSLEVASVSSDMSVCLVCSTV